MIQRVFLALFCLFGLTAAVCLSGPMCQKANASPSPSESTLAVHNKKNVSLTSSYQHWVLRHSVELSLPAFNLVIPFDGLMELSCNSGSYKALGAIKAGVTLFIISGTPTEQTIHTVHPSLRYLPNFEEKLISAMRLLNHEFISSLTYAAHAGLDANYTTKRVIHNNDLTHTIMYLGKRVTTIHENGPKGTWILNAYYPLDSRQAITPEMDGFLYPVRVTLHNVSHNFTVDITTISIQRIPYEDSSE